MLTTDFITETITNTITRGIGSTLVLTMVIALIFIVVASAALILGQHSDRRLTTMIIIPVLATGLNMFDAYKTVNTKPEINFSAQDDVKEFLEMDGYTKATAKVVNHYKGTNVDTPSTEIVYSYTIADGTERFGTASIPNELKAEGDIVNGEVVEVYYSINDSTMSRCLYDTETIEYVAKSVSGGIVNAFATRAMITITAGAALQLLLLAVFELYDKLKHYSLYKTPKKSTC